MRRLRSILACGAAAAIVAAGATGVAYADIVVADGDTAVNNSNMAFGAVTCNETVTRDATLWIERKSASNNSSAFANGAEVTFTVMSVSGAGLTAGNATSTITLPDNWISLADKTPSLQATATVQLTSASQGAGSGKVTYEATGAKYGGGTLTLTDFFNVSWTTGPCVTNSAPTQPGAPIADPTPPTQGGFTLNWAPSTDSNNDSFTYTLEGKDANDAGWSAVVPGLTTNAYTFGVGAPAEGTWTYRVRAVETSTNPALASDWSPDSAAVVVDRTGPNAPSAAASPASPYTDGSGTSWWKGSVTVTFADNGDPSLPDGSDGSGVDFVSGSQVVSAEGPFTVEGTATDNAGNVSEAIPFSGAIDSAPPSIALACPPEVIVGSSATAEWTASDTGSGVAGADNGTVQLGTSVVGPHTAGLPAGTAMDNVGNASLAKDCSYSVVYDFAGFFRPVDMGGAMNVAKSGSAIPIKFSLRGDQGLMVIAGSPTFTITGTAMDGDVIEETVTSGKSGLTYDPLTDQYTYVWKTDKVWASKSGTFTLKLVDGTTHTAKFSFTK